MLIERSDNDRNVHSSCYSENDRNVHRSCRSENDRNVYSSQSMKCGGTTERVTFTQSMDENFFYTIHTVNEYNCDLHTTYGFMRILQPTMITGCGSGSVGGRIAQLCTIHTVYQGSEVI